MFDCDLALLNILVLADDDVKLNIAQPEPQTLTGEIGPCKSFEAEQAAVEPLSLGKVTDNNRVVIDL